MFEAHRKYYRPTNEYQHVIELSIAYNIIHYNVERNDHSLIKVNP